MADGRAELSAMALRSFFQLQRELLLVRQSSRYCPLSRARHGYMPYHMAYPVRVEPCPSESSILYRGPVNTNSSSRACDLVRSGGQFRTGTLPTEMNKANYGSIYISLFKSLALRWVPRRAVVAQVNDESVVNTTRSTVLYAMTARQQLAAFPHLAKKFGQTIRRAQRAPIVEGERVYTRSGHQSQKRRENVMIPDAARSCVQRE
eukprot:6321366-Pyramimonas_sp.AAC.2